MLQAPWILGGSVLFGVAFGTLPFVISFLSLIFLAVGFSFLLLFSVPKISRPLLLVGFILSLFSFWFSQRQLQEFDTLKPIKVEQKGYRIVGIPEDKGFYQAVYLKPEGCHFSSCKEKKVLWQAPLSLEASSGERIILDCDLTLSENFSPDFDYRRYLAKEGVGYLCEEATAYLLEARDKTARWHQVLSAPKRILEEAVNRSLPEPEAGLAKGLLLGGSNYLSTDTEEQFVRLGLTHIVAVSGYNIVLIVNALLFFGLAIGLRRKQATLFAFFGIVAFILMIGSSASAVRAGIMALAAFGAFLIGRVTYSLQAVLVTAAVMVLWNPLSLWYDGGFQLSFLATIAVIISMRGIEDRLSSRAFIRALQEIVWLSVLVYLFLLPLLLLQFKTMTLLSVPANIIFLPAVPFAMFASFVVALGNILFPLLTFLIAWAAYLPLTYIMRGSYFLSNFPNISVPLTLPLALVILWYVFLLFAIVSLEERRRNKQYEKNFHCPHQH